MKNISLAAKYRPQRFEDLVGQDTIKKVFSKAVLENKVAPAYILSGTRGVGKTTIARILAKALNCENRQERNDGEPCNTCPTCQRITQNAYVDVMEIDGASNNGVDDVRKLRELVQYAPIEGKYRIIIIDEAHMLSTSAFNALLKTLEEPPAHTRFVLATTEAHKFPVTILSRSHHFVFKQVPEKTLENHVRKILNNENWQFEEGAVQLIARRGAGSVRDSLSLLDQALSFAQNPLTEELVRSILGLASKEIIDNLLDAISSANTLAIAKTTQGMVEQGIDVSYFLREFAQLWRTFFLLKEYDAQALELLQLSETEKESYAKYLKIFTKTFIHSAWQLTLESQRRITKSLEPAVALELFLINLALLPQLLPLKELVVPENESEVSQSDLAQKKNFSVETSSTQEKASSAQASNVSPSTAENQTFFQEAHNPSTLEKPVQKQEDSFVPAQPNTASMPSASNAIHSSTLQTSVKDVKNVLPSPPITGIVEENYEDAPYYYEDEMDSSFDNQINPHQLTNNNERDVLNVQAFLDFLETNKHTSLVQALKVCDKLLWIDNLTSERNNQNASNNLGNQILIFTLNAPSEYISIQLNTPSFHQLLQSQLETWASMKTRIEVHTKATPKAKIVLREELEQMDIIKEIQQTLDAHIVLCENKKFD